MARMAVIALQSFPARAGVDSFLDAPRQQFNDGAKNFGGAAACTGASLHRTRAFRQSFTGERCVGRRT